MEAPLGSNGGRRGDERFLAQLGSAAEMASSSRFREAEVEVLRALSIAPSDPRALRLLALVRYKLGRLDEARGVCREIAAASPRDAGVRLKLGLLALKLNQPEDAVAELTAAAGLAPDDWRVWTYLGYAEWRSGARARAIAAFRRAGEDDLVAELEAGPGPGASPSAPLSGDTRAAFETGLHDPGAAADPREPRTDCEATPFGQQTGSSGRAPGLVPSTSLVGFAVSRLEPPESAAAFMAGAARLVVGDEAFVRADAAIAATGAVTCVPARRRALGRTTEAPLAAAGAAFLCLGGPGEMFVGVPPGRSGRLVPLRLEEDILYLRADRVVGFEGALTWEYGRLPADGLELMQFRGTGLVLAVPDGEVGTVKVTPARPARVSPARLLGWIGRVIPRGSRDAVTGARAAEDATGDGSRAARARNHL